MLSRPIGNLYAKVFLNGQYIGRGTEGTLSDNCKSWGSDDYYEISIPRGHRVSASRLAINLYEDQNGKQSFYGRCSLEGRDLSELVATVIDGTDTTAVESLPMFDCRLYDVNQHDLPYMLELKGWRNASIRSNVISSRIRLDSNGLTLHRSLDGSVEIMLNILSIRNLSSPQSRSPSPKRNKLLFSPPDSPTFAFANQSAVASGKYNYLLEIRWNQQRVFQYQGLPHPRKLSLYTPPNYTLHECTIEILVWIDGKCIGSVVLSGDALTSFLQPVSAPGPDQAGVWFPLGTPELVPNALRADDIISNASLLLCGSIINGNTMHDVTETPIESNKSIRGRQQRIVQINCPQIISGERRVDSWSYDYSQHGKQEDGNVEDLHLLSRGQKYSRSARDVIDSTPTLSPSRASLPSTNRSTRLLEDRMKEDLVMLGYPPVKAVDVSNRRQIEYPFVKHGIPEAELDEDRICWRGQLQPKEFICPDERFFQKGVDSSSMFIPQANRLHHFQSLDAIGVLAKITELSDSNVSSSAGIITTSYARNQKLPIAVREITSHGPGLVRKHFRIEVSTHIGTNIGNVDILDTYDDLRDVIGKKGLFLLDGPQDQWDMDKIFRHIIQERVIVDIIGDKDNLLSLKSIGSTKLVQKFQVKLLRDSVAVSQPIVLSSFLSPTARLQSIANPKMSYPSPGENGGGDSSFFSSLASPKLTIRRPRSQSPKSFKVLQSSMSSDTKSSSNRSLPKATHWIRLCSKPWRMAGMRFGVVVLFCHDDIALSRNADEFFLQYETGLAGLAHVHVLFRCKNNKTEEVSDLDIPGEELAQAIDQRYNLNLSSCYRREKFGLFLVTYLMLTYEEDGQMYKIGFNYAALRMGTRYLVHMKKERIMVIDNSVKKKKYITSEETEQQSFGEENEVVDQGAEDDAISIGFLGLSSKENSHPSFDELSSRKPRLRPLDIQNPID